MFRVGGIGGGGMVEWDGLGSEWGWKEGRRGGGDEKGYVW